MRRRPRWALGPGRSRRSHRPRRALRAGRSRWPRRPRRTGFPHGTRWTLAAISDANQYSNDGDEPREAHRILTIVPQRPRATNLGDAPGGSVIPLRSLQAVLCPSLGCYRGYAAPVAVFALAWILDLADNATIISEVPPNIMLIPTSRPIAQAAVPGKPAMMSAATTRSHSPLASSHPHAQVSLIRRGPRPRARRRSHMSSSPAPISFARSTLSRHRPWGRVGPSDHTGDLRAHPSTVRLAVQVRAPPRR